MEIKKFNNTTNEFYKDLFEENSNILMLIEKETGDIVHANKVACTFYKYTYEELTSLNITNISNLSKKDIINELEKVYKEKRNYYNFTHKLKSNELRNVVVYSSAIKLNNIDYIFLIIYDSIKHKNDLIITGLFYESPNAMVILDNNQNVLYLNKSFTKLFKYKIEDFKNKTFNELLSGRILDDFSINFEKVINGETLNENSTSTTKYNQEVDVNMIATPYIIGNKIVGALIVFTDITEQNKIKKELEIIKEKSFQNTKETKEQLQLIFDSTVEGIFGLDVNGICTFCNNSVLTLLGYNFKEEILGKKIHDLIHHSYKDGRKMPYNESKITKSIQEGKSIHVENEVFWKSDGTSFDVSYYSHPQISNKEIIGLVVTFTDISERRKHEDYIKHITYHDSLTNIYNRQFYIEEIERIDKEENLPISIIFGDVNGLKLTNDIFGHKVGDILLKKSADILSRVTSNGVVSRVGGDEFTILLPKTSKESARQLVERIRNEFQKEKFEIINGTISLGYETKEKPDEVLKKVIESAETLMYKDKITNRKINNAKLIKELISSLHNKSTREKNHSDNVSKLAMKIAVELGNSANDIRKTRDAAYLHDIGKIIFNDRILKREVELTKEEKEELKQHTIIGYRILNLFDETIDLADSVLNHHEYYNGTGYPKGIMGDDIPIIARIIAVAEAYDSFTTTSIYNNKVLSNEEALEEISKESGKKYDPRLVNILIKVLTNE